MADAKTVWQRRSEAAAEQERTLLAKIKEHNAEAREQRLNGEMVFRVWYKDGGIVKRRTEVFIDERNEAPVNGDSGRPPLPPPMRNVEE